MKHSELLCVALVVACVALGLPARAAGTDGIADANLVARSEPGFAKLALDDARLILTAPVRWDMHDWLWFSADALVVAGVALAADPGVEGYVEDHNSESFSRALKRIEPFGSDYSFGVMGAFYAGGLIADDSTAKRVAGDSLMASILAGGIITPVIKSAAGRTRPIKDEGDYDFHPFSGNHSFPSGHTTQAFAVGSAIAEHYDALWIKALSYGMASLVGIARVDHKAHYVSDVVAGAMIGTSVGRAVVHINERERAGGRTSITLVVDGDFNGVAASICF